MILGIDTSSDQCAVALVDRSRQWSHTESMSRGHAEALFPMIEDVIRQAGCAVSDLSRIAVCTGPGSFTGVRAGIAAARGLALGLSIPAVGVDRFRAMWPGGASEVTIPMRGTTWAVQAFADDGPSGEPFLRDGTGIDDGDQRAALADPVRIARLAKDIEPGARPAPLYLRPADAAPSSDPVLVILDQ